MKLFPISLAAVGIMLITLSGFAAEKEQPAKEKSIFLKEVPVELTQEIDKHLEQLAKKHPVTEKERAEIETIIKEFDLKWLEPTASPDAMTEHRREQMKRIRKFGIRAIPTLTEMMVSKDDGIRRRVFDPAYAPAYVLLMTNLPIAGKKRTEEDRRIEEILIPVFRRSLMDRDPEVRLGAAGGLYLIAETRYPDIPEEIKTALAQVEAEDPVLANRQSAHLDRVRLGLTERDQELVPGPRIDH